MTELNLNHAETSSRPLLGGALRAARKRASQERGQALVEFALVLPVLVALVLGISYFGLALNSASDETQVASEIARYAAVNRNPGKEKGVNETEGSETLQAWGKKQAEKSVGANPTVCISFPEGAATNNPVRVEFKTEKHWLPVGTFLDKQTWAKISIVGSAVMRLEAPPTRYAAGCS